MKDMESNYFFLHRYYHALQYIASKVDDQIYSNISEVVSKQNAALDLAQWKM